jgi:seryl-tRNA synthetase
MQLRFPLHYKIDKDTAGELVKESVYVSKDISAFYIDENMNAVVVETGAHADQQAISDKVERYLAAMLFGYREVEPKIYLRTTRKDSGPIASQIYDELQRRQWLFEIGAGHIALAGSALRLAEWIDRYAASYYADRFGAVARSLPALIRSDILARCGYFESHPNNVTMVTHLIEDFDSIEEFRRANLGSGTLQLPRFDALESPTVCLNPAACFPVYYTLENQTIPDAGLCLTWLGRVFRYESRNINELERLWEFNVREIVFVGDDDYIAHKREQAVAFIGELAGALDLDMFIQVATDPFFATVSAAKKLWQQSMEAKYEIRLIIGGDSGDAPRTLAAGSVNLHGAFFGDQFSIRTDAGATVSTACVGLGIERLMFAAFAQHGFDEMRWPAQLRQAIF